MTMRVMVMLLRYDIDCESDDDITYGNSLAPLFMKILNHGYMNISHWKQFLRNIEIGLSFIEISDSIYPTVGN